MLSLRRCWFLFVVVMACDCGCRCCSEDSVMYCCGDGGAAAVAAVCYNSCCRAASFTLQRLCVEA